MSTGEPQESPSGPEGEPGREERWELRLYVAGQTPKHEAGEVGDQGGECFRIWVTEDVAVSGSGSCTALAGRLT